MKLKKAQADGWWIAESSYEERHTVKAAGFWWNTKVCGRVWATKDPKVALKLRDCAAPELVAELEAIIEGRAEAVAASKADNADIEIPSPEGLEYLPYQKAGVAYALGRKGTLVGDEMGLGKTIQALGVINAEHPESVLIIVPASLRLNWAREAEKWLVHDYETYVVDNSKPIPASATLVICNYDRLGVSGLDRDWGLLVVDEAHKVKNPKAKRTKKLLGVRATKDKPAVPGVVDRCERFLFLTGTPILNRPIEMSELLRVLDPTGLGKSFFGFAKRYCAAQRGRFGWDFTGASNLDELQRRLRETIMVRRLKADVLKELPSKRRQLVALAPNGAKKQVTAEAKAWAAKEEELQGLQQAADLAWAARDEQAYEEAVANLEKAAKVAFEEMAKARHQLALAKVKSFVEFAQDALESTDKIIVFGHHKDVVNAIEAGLAEYNPVKIVGDTPNAKRDEAVRRFQTDDACRVIIGSIGAMGVGLTLTAASTVLFAELDWVPANITQAEDRAHRIGQTQPVNVVHVVLDGSLDQRIAQMLIDKQAIADAALDDHIEVPRAAQIAAIPVPEVVEKPRKEPKYSAETRAKALRGVQQLAELCDGAHEKDGMGFNKLDAGFGHSLARQDELTDRQTFFALQLCRKYRKQLSWFEVE